MEKEEWMAGGKVGSKVTGATMVEEAQDVAVERERGRKRENAGERPAAEKEREGTATKRAPRSSMVRSWVREVLKELRSGVKGGQNDGGRGGALKLLLTYDLGMRRVEHERRNERFLTQTLHTSISPFLTHTHTRPCTLC